MYSSTRLENGICVVTEAMPETRSMSVGIIVDAGPRNELPDQYGVAHLAEHMMFQGTASRDAHAISRMMDETGGQMGGFTTKDYTCYSATVLDEHATYALDLMGDILLNSEYSEETLGREKQAILREMEGEMDIPSNHAHALLKSWIWGEHPLGRSVAGTPDTVNRLTREDLIYFVHGNYLPDRIVVAATGNLIHKDFVSQVRDSFWRMIGKTKAVPQPPPVFKSGVIVKNMPVKQAYFSMGISVLPYADPDRYLVHILNNIIGGGGSSRLYATLREERGMVYEIGSEYHAYVDGGLLVIEGSTTPEHLIQVLCLILVTLWRLATTEPISQEELWKAKMQIRAQHLISSENSNTRMSRLATQAYYFGRHIPGAEILAQIEKIDGEHLGSFLENNFITALKKIAICVVGPEGPDTFTQKGIESLLSDF